MILSSDETVLSLYFGNLNNLFAVLHNHIRINQGVQQRSVLIVRVLTILVFFGFVTGVMQ